jgi:cobalamin biosynthesis Mg chelatase CobN
MIDLLLDPDKALDAVNRAVSVIKKAVATVENVESLGPLLGNYFDAKAQAVAAAQHAKANGSSMGKAMEIELAIEAQREFESQLKDLFWQANKMDVWMRIKSREAQMNADAAKAAGAAKRAAAKKKQEEQEMIEIAIVSVLGVVLLVVIGWAGWELLKYCSNAGCGM